MKKTLIIFFAVFTLARLSLAQPSPKQVIKEIEFAFNHNVKLLSDDFYFKTYLSISNYQEGYFSPSQSSQIIASFLSSLPKYDFEITNFSSQNNLAYLSAKIKFRKNSSENNKRVFITLKYIDNFWQITQVTFN